MATPDQIESFEQLHREMEESARFRHSVPVENDYHWHEVARDPADNEVLKAAQSRTSLPLRGFLAMHIQSSSRSQIFELVQPWRHMIDAIESGDIEPANETRLTGLARWRRVVYGTVCRDDASAGHAAATGTAAQSPLQSRPWPSLLPWTLTGEVFEGAQVW